MASVALITGTSTGIGFETALHLARSGYDVYATMRDPGRGGPALDDAARAEGQKLHVARLDVTDPVSVTQAVDGVLRDAGRIDVLVNNAGVGTLTVIEKTDERTTEETFDTNVFGPLRMIRAVLPGMRERRSGTIVNVSSIAGHVAVMTGGLYAGSKHALEAISESLAQEVRPFGIRVVVIEPGFFKTPIIAKGIAPLANVEASSPYADTERRMHAIYSSGEQTGGDPRTVAEVIEQALCSREPRLRYLVGHDAAPFKDGRERLTDEEWVDFGRKMPEEEFWTEFARIFPMPAA